MHQLLYLKANSDIPRRRITSTARKGRKWFDAVAVGDLLDMRTTERAPYSKEGEPIARGVVIKVELATFSNVIARANENHTGQRPLPEGKTSSEVLYDELQAAYGDSVSTDVYTMLHFVVIND
jgi:hypothetical protein